MEEITAGRARFRNLTVLARHWAFIVVQGAGVAAAGIGSRLRADYLVDGSARLVDGRLVLAVAFSEVRSGEMLWGESFACEGSGWLTLQSVIPRRTVQRLFSTVEDAAHRSRLKRRPEGSSAFEHLAHGRALVRSYEPDANQRALDQFAKAISADPVSGIGRSHHALAGLALHEYDFAPPEMKLAALAEARRGVELSPDESRCHGVASAIHALAGEYERAKDAARRAVQLNPCDADALFNMAYALMICGRPAECIVWLERAKGFNPLWPPHYDEVLAYALYDM